MLCINPCITQSFQDLNFEDLSMWALQPIPCINGKDLAQHPSEGMVYCWVWQIKVGFDRCWTNEGHGLPNSKPKKDKHVNLIQPPEKLNGGIPQTFWNVRTRFVVSLRIWCENVELWSDGPGVRKPSKAPGGSGSEVQKMYGCLWSLDRW